MTEHRTAAAQAAPNRQSRPRRPAARRERTAAKAASEAVPEDLQALADDIATAVRAIGSAEFDDLKPGLDLSLNNAQGNLALFDGIALASVAVLRRPSWALVLAVPVVTWFAGVDPPSTVRWWALPLQPEGDSRASVVASAVALAGAALHLGAPTGVGGRRGWRRR